MNRKKLFGVIGLLFALSIPILAQVTLTIPVINQQDNPNLITRGNRLSRGSRITFEASSKFTGPTYNTYEPSRVLGERLQSWWETDKEKEGAWISLKWNEPQKIKELWIVNKASLYDVGDPYDLRTPKYLVPRVVKVIFSDGSNIDAELKLCEYYQIITLPKEIITSSLKLAIEKVWDGSGEVNTGICKIMAFSKPNPAGFKVSIFEMYDVQNDKPVQSAKIQIVNPGSEIKGAKVLVIAGGKNVAACDLTDIPANSATIQQIWIPAVYSETNLTFKISSTESVFTAEQNIDVKPYNKNYFDGGTFDIYNTNHNDLGWLNTLALTADFRSSELIIPAMDMMKKDPDFKYTMESVEYLKEFLVRNPDRKDEMAKLMKEKRFAFGASYVQNLQVQVGQERLIRNIYYGRRWLLENFPGCDTRFYINTDIPGLTYQLPQILKKSGIDYIVQGRMAWGFYYWEGLDGTSIPMFAFRYYSPYSLMNPVNNTGWIKHLNDREYYYKPRQMPKSMLYDWNSDYLPPSPEMIPFAKNQNIAMKKFATIWNDHFLNEPAKQITPPVIRFVEPEGVLSEIFGKGEINIETMKGDWPMAWAYFDDPGHRDGLLAGRKGLTELVNAEGLFSWLNTVDKSAVYPKDKLDKGWLANCWPDHGWGNNLKTPTDSTYEASYIKSFEIGKSLTNSAGSQLLNLVPQGDKNQIPVVVYNTVGWDRSDITFTTIHYPKNWKGLELKDGNGNSVPVEILSHSPEKQSIEVAFMVKDIPSFGFKTYFATAAKSFPKGYTDIKGDSVENDMVKVKFGSGGITSFYDKVSKKEVLRTDKFFWG